MVSLWEWLAEPPGSTLFILGVSILLSFIYSYLRRLFTPKQDINELRAWQKEIAEWEAESKKAKRTGDKRLLRKVKKQEKRIQQLRSKMASQSLGQIKLMPLSMLLFFLIWLALTGRFLYWTLFDTPYSSGGTVAYLPWFGLEPLPLNLIMWYFLCSFGTGSIVTRVLGPQTGASG